MDESRELAAAASERLEEIDEPGEYFVDREARHIYFYPSEPELKQLQLSVMDQPFFTIDGASCLRVEGLTFECARGLGIEVKGGSAVALSRHARSYVDWRKRGRGGRYRR